MKRKGSLYKAVSYNFISQNSSVKLYSLSNLKFNFRTIYHAIIIICFVIFITNPIISIDGAKNGLLLWYQTVVPTLLPCMILANLLVKIGLADSLARIFFPLTKRLFKLSISGTYALLIGILCGYPLGAKTISDLILEEKITKKEGQYLLAFANFPSPMFIAGYVATWSFHLNSINILLLSIYLPLIPLSFISKYFYKYKNNTKTLLPQNVKTINHSKQKQTISTNFITAFELSMTNSIEVIVKIGGYLMFFSIITSFLSYIPYSNDWYYYIIVGITEMTTGIKAISMSNFNLDIKILYAVICAAFGGVSTIAQTNTVLQKSGLSLKHYIFWKILNCIIAGIICYIFIII